MQRFDESSLLCRNPFGWNGAGLLRVQNVTQNRPLIEMLYAETLHAIEATNQLD